jgi:Galactoside-binding lectin
MAPPNPSSSWKNPPSALQVKYNVISLPEDFNPTQQEKELLEMYETMKQYEKEAARLKEEAARAKLEAAAARYEESRNPSSIVKKKKTKKKNTDEDHLMENLRNDDEIDDDDSDDDDMESSSFNERRVAKIDDSRDSLEETIKEERMKEELRFQMLGNDQLDDDLDGAYIKKRRRLDIESEENKASLIANITPHETPPYEFSKRLEIKSWEGVILFPNESNSGQSWTPPASASNPNEDALAFELDDFDISKTKVGNGRNTIAIKFMAPPESKRFSINIAGPNHGSYHSVLFHFNPRQFEKGGQLVLNNKQEGMWGQAVNVPLSRIPKIFGEISCTVIIQIHDDGFDVFLDDRHCARLEHRENISGQNKLYLQFPATDDRGQKENWSVYRVWWGYKNLMAKDDLVDIYGVNAFVGMHPKKLFIKGLSTIHTEAEIDLRRAVLERAFRKYGGDRGVLVTIPTNATFAFVECETEQMASLALEEKIGEYDIRRARRKRIEIIQEERAAALDKSGKTNTEWD